VRRPVFFLLDTLARAHLIMTERHRYVTAFRIQRRCQPAKCAAHKRNNDREREGSDVAAECLGKRAEEPLQRKESPLLLAGFLDFSISARHEAFQVTARL